MILPTQMIDCRQQLRWWDAFDPGVSLDHTDSLEHIIRHTTWRPARQIAGTHERRYLYARIGTHDNIMHPLLESGSIVRVIPDTHPAPAKTRAIHLVQHARGLTCGYLEFLDGGTRVLVLPASTPRPVAEGLLDRDVFVLGTIDAEIRPVAGPALSTDSMPATTRLRQSGTAPLARSAVRHVGQLTRLHRERLNLDFRHAHELTTMVAARMGDHRYAISLGALSDYETMDNPPRRIEKLFTLCAIYGMDLSEYLRVSGVFTEAAPHESPHGSSRPSWRRMRIPRRSIASGSTCSANIRSI